jgi:hypothetical protein
VQKRSSLLSLPLSLFFLPSLSSSAYDKRVTVNGGDGDALCKRRNELILLCVHRNRIHRRKGRKGLAGAAVTHNRKVSHISLGFFFFFFSAVMQRGERQSKQCDER